MSRALRPHLPYAVFHITARTHRKERWFEDVGIRHSVAAIINETTAFSDAKLLAYTVMANHFHLVLRQGRRPLGWTMQPIMRRIALLVQRGIEIEGHVFERRYFSVHCNGPTYLRRAIVYTHLNPHRAGICDANGTYSWSSHSCFVDGAETNLTIDAPFVLPLFAHTDTLDIPALRAQYARHVAWRLEKDACLRAERAFSLQEPEAECGDAYFAEHFAGGGPSLHPPRKDLRDCAIDVLQRIDPRAGLAELRQPYGPRSSTQLRNRVITALLQAGYRGKNIADFMRVSDATVSAIAGRVRYTKS